ncbi:MAG: helix-turn-helix domain-containing protein [Clostridia bacterium]|nr:helix-turn-helix domain-containing protein [Clostridia bacterium]
MDKFCTVLEQDISNGVEEHEDMPQPQRGTKKKPPRHTPMINLKFARLRAQLSQDELAKMVGVSKYRISDFETGRSAPKKGVLEKIADILGVTTEHLKNSPMKNKA